MAIASRVLDYAEKTGRRRGINGRSGTWLGIWVAAAGYRRVRRFFEEEPVVVRESLKPGQQLIITHYAKGEDPPVLGTMGRRARKKAAKRAKKASTRGQSSGGSITAEVVSIDE